ncbi:DUF4099 domain-containing protein [Pedobacter sp. Leaf194]|uniref:DUF4099 domain-containing protein n=1 Tax=Pedobacter sp. Leaf194 TaxID=1736297 RepID=UPI0007032DA3|nr:DUF4099 domain-containing protein [Pedobacter sp. Leaf194]KQS36149.1 hypothetical protein ASG14_12000 [Pedobacter sp. Leaf194]
MNYLFSQNDLPFQAMEALGLSTDDDVLLESTDFKALLAGRRTGLLTLSGLSTEYFQIERLDARLSLQRNLKGEVELRLHPIYKNVQGHSLLSGQEVSLLSSSKEDFLQKGFQDSTGGTSLMIFEYDALTRDFITYFPEEVQVPDFVNGYALSPAQQSGFKRGEALELEDGTRLQHRASESKGILSNRAALVLSVVVDGGQSYFLIRGIRAIKGEEGQQVDYNTPGYKQAFAEMQRSLQLDTPARTGYGLGFKDETQQSRGLGPAQSR